jgi:DHA2 family multidrug resistance protein
MREAGKHRGAITICVMAATTMQALDTTIANIALPHMQGSFAASQDQTDWVLTSYIVAAAIATPPTGFLADRFGRTRLFLTAVIGFTVASVLCGLAQSIEEMVLFRLLQGLFGASLVPLSQSVLLDIYPKEKQGSAMALWGVGVMVGPILGPTLGGWLTENYDWRWVFFINLPVGALTWLGLTTFLKEKSRTGKLPFDWMGFATLSLAIAALQLMADRGEQLDWLGSPEIIIEAVVAALAFYLFLVHTMTTKNPFISPALFRDRNFVLGISFIFIAGVVLLSTMALLTPFLQTVMGYPVITAGLTLGPRGIGMMVSMFIVGRLMGRIDVRLILLVGVGLMAYSLYVMTGFTDSEPQSIVIESGLEQGFGLGFLFVPMTTITFSTLPPALRTEAAGIYSLSRNIGSAIGISIFATLLQQNTQANHAEIAAYINPFNRSFDAGMLTGANASGNAVALDAAITNEASVIAYLDDFKAMMLVGLILLPIVLLLRVKREAAPPPPGHAVLD